MLEIDRKRFGDAFDVVFMEGGILHYFHDIDAFMDMMYILLKPGGIMICSDFHPFTKIADLLETGSPAMSYFSQEVFEGEMAHARFLKRKSGKRCQSAAIGNIRSVKSLTRKLKKLFSGTLLVPLFIRIFPETIFIHQMFSRRSNVNLFQILVDIHFPLCYSLSCKGSMKSRQSGSFYAEK